MFGKKAYRLLTLLSVLVVCSVCDEEKPRPTESSSDGRRSMLEWNLGSLRRKDQTQAEEVDADDVDERLAAIAASADSRHSSMGASEGDQRTRTRWSAKAFKSPFENLAEGNDRSRPELSSLLSSASKDASASAISGSSCHSLVDPQYPIFSDVCGAVPQARYALPNMVGHRERWQVAQALNAFVSAPADPSCTRSLRLLICPALFSPCPSRHEPPAVLPCQSYCRAVKARCGTPALDFLRCEALPPSSDLCPTSQTYGSFAPPEPSPPKSKPSPLTDGSASSNLPISRAHSPLRSLLLAKGLPGSLSQSSLPSGPHQPSGAASLNNVGASPMDSPTSFFVDAPPRLHGKDPRQGSRYSPLARAAFDARAALEMRAHPDLQFAIASRPAGISSMLKA